MNNQQFDQFIASARNQHLLIALPGLDLTEIDEVALSLPNNLSITLKKISYNLLTIKIKSPAKWQNSFLALATDNLIESTSSVFFSPVLKGVGSKDYECIFTLDFSNKIKRLYIPFNQFPLEKLSGEFIIDSLYKQLLYLSDTEQIQFWQELVKNPKLPIDAKLAIDLALNQQRLIEDEITVEQTTFITIPRSYQY